MTPTATATAAPLVNQGALQTELGIGRWMINDRIRRFPPGSRNAFPVEYVGRWRRFNVVKVRNWFAAEKLGFPSAA